MFSVDISRYKPAVVQACETWLVNIFGVSGEEWLMCFEEDEHQTIFVHFRLLENAEMFTRYFERDYLCFSYDSWLNFCISPHDRRKIEEMWVKKKWRPTIAVIGYPHLHPRTLGYKALYMPANRTWFFEHDVDIIMFYLEFGDGKGHNRH